MITQLSWVRQIFKMKLTFVWLTFLIHNQIILSFLLSLTLASFLHTQSLYLSRSWSLSLSLSPAHRSWSHWNSSCRRRRRCKRRRKKKTKGVEGGKREKEEKARDEEKKKKGEAGEGITRKRKKKEKEREKILFIFLVKNDKKMNCLWLRVSML